ncbi:flagellar biosynthesis protein FlhG [Lentibacillus halodurans]|uniref:Flagellar biosynthesis protein FlhG n=1 Tax=Lentibacillus halodurans TaxID=237679 RepID=A0A1I0VLY4_9BACI|nr:MinD/ParA family protein [Lentibacillus halodurans]SFA77301.1 flagellar biosynthesis protein FlhG [Lentibacillus halodurans]
MIHDQAAKLRRKLGMTQRLREAKTISVVSGKGGVGKSNVALNFSLELLRHGKKVLLFDLDIGMGNVDVLLGLDTHTTIADMFAEQLSVHEIIKTGPRGLAYVSGGSGLNDLLTLDRTMQNYFFQQFEELIYIYDYIIFDMGAGATHDSLSIVAASDEGIVLTTPEPTAITDAYGMIKHIVNHKPDLPLSVIMNRTASAKNGQQALERFHRVIQQFLNKEVRKLGILPDDKTVSTAVIRQIPFVLLNEKAAVSKGIKKIVASYLEDKPEADDNASISFIQKIKQLMGR